MLVHRFLEESARIYPDKVAVIHGPQRITYRELNEKSDQLAHFLSDSGIKAGERVGFVLDNSIPLIISYFAILKVGAITVAQNTLNSAAYFSNVFNESGTKLIITQNKFALNVSKAIADVKTVTQVVLADSSKIFQDLTDIKSTEFDEIFSNKTRWSDRGNINENTTASIVFTSGSTGHPKGVVLSHGNLVSNTEAIVSYLELSESDRIMVILPFSYTYGTSLLLTHFMVGGSLVINNSFTFPKVVLDELIKEKCTGFSGVPTNFILLLEKTDIRKRDFPDLKYITQAGGAMAPDTTLELKSTLPEHVKIFIMYGQAEASTRLSYFCLNGNESKLGSIGKAIPTVTLSLITRSGEIARKGEEGEIVVTGPNIMQGYWNQPDETKLVLKDDGLHTGDIGRIDEDGFFYIVGRIKEMIKSGANRVSAKEIEEVLITHEGILEVAVIGVPDHIMGEAIKAFIVKKDDADFDEKQISMFCKKNMAMFKVPKYITFLHSLPKNQSGKILKTKLQ